MTIESLRGILSDENFYSPYSRNKALQKVSRYQPVEKVMFVYKLLASTESYPFSSPKKYAEIAQRLFERFEIPCYIVSGVLKNHREHDWNIVIIDGHAFHIDAYFACRRALEELRGACDEDTLCIDDIDLDDIDLDEIDFDDDFDNVDFTCYDFFCVSTQSISQTHTFDENNLKMDCPHSLSHELVHRLAAMRVEVHTKPIKLTGIRPIAPIEVDYTTIQEPITLTFE